MVVYVGRGQSLPADIALSLIPSLPRPALERLVQRLIDGLDDMDAPAEDMEDDDPAGMMDEDELTTGPGVFVEHGTFYRGSGCPIADPGELGCTDLPMVTHDGEDQTVVVLPAPREIEPYRFRVS
ncbi:hypothetical protein BWQ93_01645 [Sphingopyxis sp. QXT-31]|nr:hypothetical protein BWQ93_01645 [Sphingopyxis sp. QXT-31]